MRKLLGPLFVAALLVVLVPAAGAAEPPAAADLQSHTLAPPKAEPAIALDDLFAPAGDCGSVDAVAPLAVDGEARRRIVRRL